jgi:ABC-type transport system substrate-binding protein
MEPGLSISRRDLLKLGGGVAGAAAIPCTREPAAAQAPKRGGVFRLRGEDPVGFDPQLTVAFKTMMNLSFTHSRLVKVKAGSGVPPGTLPLEPDLAESWTQPSETTYVFTLRKGVRWHPKPPVNGRELTADDVKYTYERFLGTRGNPNRGSLEAIDRIEALDRHTVRFMLKEPYAWFLDALAGKYDFAPESGMVVRRLDLDIARQRKPGLQMAEHVVGFGGITWMKLDQEPFRDVRVRRALAQASNWREILETNAWSQGHGVPNPAVPAAFREWSIPLTELPPESRRLYEHNTAEAKRLLREAGLPNGFRAPLETTSGYGPDWMDAVQVTLKNWKSAGIEIDLKLKEYGAYISTTIFGKFERMANGLFGLWLVPDSYLYNYYVPGQMLNASGVNDPKLTDMIRLQRRTFDVRKRRDIIYDIQRHCAQQTYQLYGPSVSAVAAWELYVKNFGPNIGFDYGGRLMVAWLDR